MTEPDSIRLAICLIAKNEGPFLPEWLEYHLMIGIDHFFIYDNGSVDNSFDVYQEYAKHITLQRWPDSDNPQRDAYRHFCSHHGVRYDWAAFIDADEFIVLKSEGTLKSYLARYSEQHGLMLEWRLFGTSGHKIRPAGLVMENFIHAHSVSPEKNIKSIGRPQQIIIDNIFSPHRFPYRNGGTGIPVNPAELCVYHYVLRSVQDVKDKIARGCSWSASNTALRRAEQDRIVAEKLATFDGGDMVDLYMMRYVPEVRDRLRMQQTSTTLLIS